MTSADRRPRTGVLAEGHISAASAAEELLALREENRQLKEGMLSRARIDQAMGVLVALAGISPDHAWDLLREVSMTTNTKLRTVAEALVHWPVGGALPDDVREALDAAVTKHRRPVSGPETKQRPTRPKPTQALRSRSEGVSPVRHR